MDSRSMQQMGMGAGLGSLGAGLGQLWGNQGNPADAGMGYLQNAQNMLPQYYQPWINAGQQSLPTLQEQYNNLINNPTGVMNQIGAGYHQSPGFQWQLGQSEQAANNAAAANGMTGSPQHQQQAATIANGLANQDYYNYMNMGLSQYGMGLGGLNDMSHMGYGASNDLASNMANLMQSQASMGYAGQINQNQSQGGAMGSILGGLGTAAGFMGL